MLPVPRLDHPRYLGVFRCNFMQFVFKEVYLTLISSMYSLVEITQFSKIIFLLNNSLI